jgi:hypothetical protein
MRTTRDAFVNLTTLRTVAKLAAASLAGCLLAGVGCAADPMATDFKSVKSNLTPELMTISERKVDVERNLATAENQNYRMFWNDLGRMMYVDRPSILSPYFIIPTSGQPR